MVKPLSFAMRLMPSQQRLYRTRDYDTVMREDREILAGQFGGTYYIDDDGTRVYLRKKKKPNTKNRLKRLKRGAFYRSMQNQIDSAGEKLFEMGA